MCRTCLDQWTGPINYLSLNLCVNSTEIFGDKSNAVYTNLWQLSLFQIMNQIFLKCNLNLKSYGRFGRLVVHYNFRHERIECVHKKSVWLFGVKAGEVSAAECLCVLVLDYVGFNFQAHNVHESLIQSSAKLLGIYFIQKLYFYFCLPSINILQDYL